jgi:hypothetical protein
MQDVAAEAGDRLEVTEKIICLRENATTVRRKALGSQANLDDLLRRFHALELVDDETGVDCKYFKSLIDGRLYNLRTPTVARAGGAGGTVVHRIKRSCLPTKRRFNCRKMLVAPNKIPLTIRRGPREPEFIHQKDWLKSSVSTVVTNLDSADDVLVVRVPPMVLASFSRSGKTRCMKEVGCEANGMDATIRVIFVSFNDWSPISDEDHNDPLQALCLRIAFVCSTERRKDEDKRVAYDDFCAKKYFIKPKELLSWAKGCRLLLIVDELNLLRFENGGTEFANFIRNNFLAPKGRYFMFSSHKITTASKFQNLIDGSAASSGRDVIFQSLPVIDDLFKAKQHLSRRLDGAVHAVYYGLTPGLIFTERDGLINFGAKRFSAITKYVNDPAMRLTKGTSILKRF